MRNHAETTEMRDISTLVPYARNSRTHSPEQIKQIENSIREFGWTMPVLVDETGMIIAGHGRVLAASNIGMTEVPVVVATGWTDSQKRAYVIADNKIASNAEWDKGLLALELSDLKSADYDLGLTGFNKSDLASFVSTGKGGLTDEDEIPEPPVVPVSAPGDVWLLGAHRVMCGDSTSTDAVAILMGGAMADMVWTDPPYNVAINGKAGSILNDDMPDSAFAEFLFEMYTAMYENMRPGAVIYVAHADSERVNFTQQYVAAKFKLAQVLIWAKQSATLSRQDFNWQHEPIIYGWKPGAGHYFCGDFCLTTVIDDDIDIRKLSKPQLLEMVNELRTEYKTTILRHNRPTKSDLHPTMKPVALVEKMIKWSSKYEETVLDVFGGSGSTLIACQKAGRIGRLMELDPKYVDIIVNRWRAFTGGEAVLESNGKTFDEVKNARA